MSFDIFRIVADLHKIEKQVSRHYGELRRETAFSLPYAESEEPVGPAYGDTYPDLAALKESLDRSIELAERMAVGAGAADART